jgi:hypothetical protein
MRLKWKPFHSSAMVADAGFEPRDLKGMNLASYQAAPICYNYLLVRVKRVELLFAASETVVLPLDDTRINFTNWLRGKDSNLDK